MNKMKSNSNIFELLSEDGRGRCSSTSGAAASGAIAIPTSKEADAIGSSVESCHHSLDDKGFAGRNSFTGSGSWTQVGRRFLHRHSASSDDQLHRHQQRGMPDLAAFSASRPSSKPIQIPAAVADGLPAAEPHSHASSSSQPPLKESPAAASSPALSRFPSGSSNGFTQQMWTQTQTSLHNPKLLRRVTYDGCDSSASSRRPSVTFIKSKTPDPAITKVEEDSSHAAQGKRTATLGGSVQFQACSRLMPVSAAENKVFGFWP